MKFMILVKASKESEAGVMPSTELLTEMGRYNEALVNAGVLVAGEGLHPSSKGVRVRFSGDQRTVIEGPFPETKELIAGFWIFQVSSRKEAIEWVKRAPNPMPGTQSEIEIRQIVEAEDFGDALTPELREQERRLRAQSQQQRQGPPPVAGGATPHLTVRGASDAAEFYKRAFGAQELFRMPAQDGRRLMHCHLKINGGDVLLCDEFPEHGATLGPGPNGVTVHLAVDDADRWWKRAVDAGATVVMPIADQFWGDRYGQLRDPFGHTWSIGSPIRG